MKCDREEVSFQPVVHQDIIAVSGKQNELSL